MNDLIKHGLKGSEISPTDIGIISPYRAQRDIIEQKFAKKFKGLEIGTVDAFQGREKKIIIMSCVRSKTRHVGFLRNEKRLNVALTRAKALLIIIGNASTLQMCPIWNKFIKFCNENKAVVKKGKSFKENEVIVEDTPEVGDEYD